MTLLCTHLVIALRFLHLGAFYCIHVLSNRCMFLYHFRLFHPTLSLATYTARSMSTSFFISCTLQHGNITTDVGHWMVAEMFGNFYSSIIWHEIQLTVVILWQAYRLYSDKASQKISHNRLE